VTTISRIIREDYSGDWIDWDEAELAGATDRWFRTFQVYLLKTVPTHSILKNV